MSRGVFTMKKIFLLGLMLMSANVFAGLSKWTDAEGNVHYSDQPPPDKVQAKTLRTASSAAATSNVAATSAPATPKTVAEQEVEYKKAQLAKKEAADKAAREQSRIDAQKANCALAQQNLRTLQDGMRMMEVDPKGNRSYVDDNQRRQRTEKAQQEVNTYCK